MIGQINCLKLSLQKSIEREEQIERELQAEKAREDELSKKIGQLEAAEEKVTVLVGALAEAINYITASESRVSANYSPGIIDKDIVHKWQQALAKAKG